MQPANDNTPVVVGLGFLQVQSDNPADCPEAAAMMVQVAQAAGRDAGNPAILRQLDSIAVQKGSWKYPDPGRLVAQAVGSPAATTILSDLGVLQIQTFLDLCDAIAAGRQQAGLVIGAEARYRELRSLISGEAVTDTVQPDGTQPDVFHAIPDPFMSTLDDRLGVWTPGEYYALAESAWRHRQGLSIEAHRLQLAQLYSDFSAIAARNPHAWNREILSVDDMLALDRKNPMLAFPYSKRMMSQWNVNQAVAIIVCSLKTARELQLDESRWIYPLAAATSKRVTLLVQKRELDSNPGTVLSGRKMFELAGLAPQDVTIAELYSPFASAIRCAQRDLQLPPQCPFNISGSMAHAGGPFNHGGVDSLARMVEVLRAAVVDKKNAGEKKADEKHIGLVNSLSGMFGKHGCCLLSPQPGSTPFALADVSAAVARVETPIPLDGDYAGPATVVACTVLYNKETISHAIAYCDTPAGKRTVVRSDDMALAERMTREEFVGKTITITAGKRFGIDEMFGLAPAPV